MDGLVEMRVGLGYPSQVRTLGTSSSLTVVHLPFWSVHFVLIYICLLYIYIRVFVLCEVILSVVYIVLYRIYYRMYRMIALCVKYVKYVKYGKYGGITVKYL